MPLKEGSSDETVSDNISMLIKEGKSKDQATAIAMEKAGRSKGDSLLGQTVHRYDQATLSKPEKTVEGFLKADAFLTRAGLFEYPTPNGKRVEFRPETAVFDSASLETLKMKPVTDEHPVENGQRVLVTTDNIGPLTKGNLGENIERVGNNVRARILVTDSEMIAAVLGGRNQLSCGYLCTLKFDGGTFDGKRYDAIQSDIVYNHIAIVRQGRAGPDVAMRIDSADGIALELENLEPKEEEHATTRHVSRLHLLKPRL